MQSLRLSAAYAALFLVSVSLSATEVFVQVPADQTEAQRMLADGVLDSATWRRLEPYYAQPLAAPEGELAVLEEVFPGRRPADFPSDPRVLRRYEPWSDDDVGRFLADYPHLREFLPLLSFTHTNERTWGRFGFRLRRYGQSSQTQYANFRLSPASCIDLRGRLSFSAEAVAWRRRSVRAEIPHIGRLEVGNFGGGFDDRLFFGYFPTARDSGLSASKRMFYGEYSSWNGLHWRKRIGNGPEFRAFYHTRRTESAAGVRGGCRTGHGATVSAGGTALSTSSTETGRDDTVYAAHGGFTVERKTWEVAGRMCAVSEDVHSVPFSLRGSHRGERFRFSLDLAHMPPGFPAKRSRIAYELSRRSATDTSQESGTLVELRIAGELASHLRDIVTLSYAFSPRYADAGVRFALYLSRPIRLRLSYSYHPVRYPDRGISRYHRLSAYVAHAFSSSWRGRLTCRMYMRVHEYQSVRLRLVPTWVVGRAVELQPFGYYSWTSSSGADFGVGILQRLELSPKTYGKLSLEVPWSELTRETVAFNVSTQFLF